MRTVRKTLHERRKNRPIRKLNKILNSEGFVLNDKDTQFIVVFRDGEFYFLTPNDSIPFYYDFYSK